MSWLTDERQAIADRLASDDLPAMIHVPARPYPPFTMVLPGSPYLADGETFGEKVMRAEVWLVAGAGDTPPLADALDDQIARAIDLLEADEVTVENVAQPIAWQPSSGGEHLVAVLTATVHVRPPSNP